MKVSANTVVPIDDIKNEISSSVGRTIVIKEFNRQKKFIHQYIGIILEVYDSVFLVDVNVNKYHIKKSFSYVNFSIGDMSFELE